MSLPEEKQRAVIWTKRFLEQLITPSQTPGVPRAIREQALHLLRHYPYDSELKRMTWL